MIPDKTPDSKPPSSIKGKVELDHTLNFASLETDWMGRHIRIEVSYPDKEVSMNRALKDFANALSSIRKLDKPINAGIFELPKDQVTVFFDEAATKRMQIINEFRLAVRLEEPSSDESSSKENESSVESRDIIEKKISKNKVNFKESEIHLIREGESPIDLTAYLETIGDKKNSKLAELYPGRLEKSLRGDNASQAFDRLMFEAVQDLKNRGIVKPKTITIISTMQIFNMRSINHSRQELEELFKDLKLKLGTVENDQVDDPIAIKQAEQMLGGLFKTEVKIKKNLKAKEANAYTINYKLLDDAIFEQMIKDFRSRKL